MKIAIVNINGNKKIIKILKKEFRVVKNNPDVVFSIGGDGTILLSERLYPSIPKIAIKTSSICRKCEYTPTQLLNLLNMIKNGKYKIEEKSKIEAEFKNKKLIALNEIQVRNKNPSIALRFSVKINEKIYENLIGDGIIVSTPFGSTAYYMSAGGKPFNKGIGIAFNNLHNHKIMSLVVDENSKIIIKIEREDGLLIRDNDSNFVNIKKGDKVIIKKSKEKAKFIKF